MCALSFMPKKDDAFILTSNRDESPLRDTLPPREYKMDGTRLLFPKDAEAGGTWIGISEKKRLICLLNGGFEAHVRQNNYRLSRGIIVTDLLTANNAHAAITAYDFNGIEPFTIILVEWHASLSLFELIWDGKAPHFSERSLKPHIWSSSLLYTQKVKSQRERWFNEFLAETDSPDNEQLLYFHKKAGDGNKETSLVMDRNFVKTKSITQIVKDKTEVTMRYIDLQSNKNTASIF